MDEAGQKQPIAAPQIIADLVARFEEHRDTYKRGDYNETQLRREFLDPFFGLQGLPEIKNEHERKVIQRQIDATDTQIDRLVYELYGLSADEIRLVEEATA
jgi:hypothetical protein